MYDNYPHDRIFNMPPTAILGSYNPASNKTWVIAWQNQQNDLPNLIRVSAVRMKKSKKISNDQELIQSDPTSCPQNQKGNN